jgi:hypothetical protein
MSALDFDVAADSKGPEQKHHDDIDDFVPAVASDILDFSVADIKSDDVNNISIFEPQTTPPSYNNLPTRRRTRSATAAAATATSFTGYDNKATESESGLFTVDQDFTVNDIVMTTPPSASNVTVRSRPEPGPGPAAAAASLAQTPGSVPSAEQSMSHGSSRLQRRHNIDPFLHKSPSSKSRNSVATRPFALMEDDSKPDMHDDVHLAPEHVYIPLPRIL